MPRRLPDHDRIIAGLKGAGVERIFGMPGGGGNSDLIEAAGRAGFPFSLAHGETASALMACAQAEITGRPGACIATLGPGAASLMNGVAHAWLDRVPLIVMTDCAEGGAHQNLPQRAMFSPVVKWSAGLSYGCEAETLSRAVQIALAPPAGPVHLDVGGEADSAEYPVPSVDSDVALAAVSTRRPILLIGLGARTAGTAAAIRELCESCRIPALVTYKAKGVVPDGHPWFGGVFTNAMLEREILNRADAFFCVGLDRVELLPRPWTLRGPVVDVPPGKLEWLREQLTGGTDWIESEVRELLERQLCRMRVARAGDGMLPHRVVETAAEYYGGVRATVDAGAHMFPVMTFWPAQRPCGVLISNGLSTMGFALPAAIGASLLDGRPVAAFTGDGGLLMCLAELRTAAREAIPLRIVVFDDGSLSLIRLKQLQRGYSTASSSIGKIDWCAVGAGLGLTARHADTEDELAEHFRESLEHAGPFLISARVDGESYRESMRVLRGTE